MGAATAVLPINVLVSPARDVDNAHGWSERGDNAEGSTCAECNKHPFHACQIAQNLHSEVVGQHSISLTEAGLVYQIQGSPAPEHRCKLVGKLRI